MKKEFSTLQIGPDWESIDCAPEFLHPLRQILYIYAYPNHSSGLKENRLMKKRRALRSSRTKKLGLAPGSVVYIGLKDDRDLKIDLIRYNEDQVEELKFNSPNPGLKKIETGSVNWLIFNGLKNVKEVETVGKHFGMSNLDVEDIVNTAQRPALNANDAYLVLIMKMLSYDKDFVLSSEHISFVLFKDSLITFHESDREEFQSIKERLQINTGRLRSKGSDYLMYALIDSIVDHYFQLVESLTDKTEALEDKIFENKNRENITDDIQALKKELLRIRRAVNPLNEITARLKALDSDLLTDKTQEYMRDLHDHVGQVMELIEMNREMIWGLMDMHMTLLSNKMNEVMKVLTIISTIFIPLSFVAGIYGMNFEHMPELEFKYAYFILLGFMGLMIVLMLFYFRRKRWL